MTRIGTVWLIAALLGGCATPPPAGLSDSGTRAARRILTSAPVFDGHNDLAWQIREATEGLADVDAYDLRSTVSGHTDIRRLRQGMVGAQFWSVYVPVDAVEEGAAKVQLEQMDIARRVFRKYPDAFQETLSSSEVMSAFRSGRIASVIGMEGGHVIENSLGALRTYYDLGARYLTLTHSQNTDWADSATDEPEHDGLTAFGEEVVREMNRLGMLVDLSHVSPATMHDALDVSEAPVIFSHSSARAITDVPRNVPDDVLRRLPDNGGLVMVTFVPGFVNSEVAAWEANPSGPAPSATVADVIRHIEHIRDVAGIDHVGIGGDFDGIGSTPVGLEDVSTYPTLFEALIDRGWNEADLRKLASGNMLRVWREAERVSTRLRQERGASLATIEELDG